jgi:hypothetical protein
MSAHNPRLFFILSGDEILTAKNKPSTQAGASQEFPFFQVFAGENDDRTGKLGSGCD